MRPNIISKPKEKHLNWGENESSIKRVFVFLQTESWVCTWDLNQGTRLQNHPGREGCVKLHRSREEIPCSKDRGVKKEWMKKQNGRVKMTVMRVLEIQAHTHTQWTYTVWSPFNIKSRFIVNVGNKILHEIYHLTLQPLLEIHWIDLL